MAKAHSPNCPFWVLFRRDNLAIFRAMCYAIGKKFETTHEVAAKERHRKKPSKKDGEKRREEKLRGRKRVVSENKAATAQKGKPLRHGKGLRGR